MDRLHLMHFPVGHDDDDDDKDARWLQCAHDSLVVCAMTIYGSLYPPTLYIRALQYTIEQKR